MITTCTWTLKLFDNFWIALGSIATSLAVLVGLYQIFANKRSAERVTKNNAAIKIFNFLKSEQRKLDIMKRFNKDVVRELFNSGSLNMSVLNPPSIDASANVELYFPHLNDLLEDYLINVEKFIFYCNDLFAKINEQIALNGGKPTLIKLPVDIFDEYDEKLKLCLDKLNSLKEGVAQEIRKGNS